MTYLLRVKNTLRQRVFGYFLKGAHLTIIERYFFLFSINCISLLSVFCILNLAMNFFLSFWIDLLGILFYISILFLYRRLFSIAQASGLLILNSCVILLLQSIILGPDAFHNMLFFPAVAVFCFALFETRKNTIIHFSITCLAMIASYLIPKNFNTTICYLSSGEKSLFLILSAILSLVATYQIGAVLYKQKEDAFQKLNMANRELGAALEKNKKLLQLITHDISNPLFHIEIALQMNTRDGPKDEKFERIYKPAVSTIKDIIDFSRQLMALEDGKIISEIQQVNLVQMIEEVELIFSEQLRVKNIHLHKSIHLNEDTMILADPKLLRASILSNIFSNAIKFSYPGSSIRVEVSESIELVILKVIDDGIGIPTMLLEKIFKAEETTARVGTLGERGTGYGLPLASAFMKSMGGKISCDSQEGKGTCVTLEFKKNQNPGRENQLMENLWPSLKA
jgi:signal transduction histidine kinase